MIYVPSTLWSGIARHRPLTSDTQDGRLAADQHTRRRNTTQSLVDTLFGGPAPAWLKPHTRVRRMVNPSSLRIETGRQYQGTVRHVSPYGAFIEIAPGKEGLLHVTEALHPGNRHHGRDLRQHLQVGQTLTVEVSHYDTARERITLSLPIPLE